MPDLSDKQNIKLWQETKDPGLYAQLFMRYQPIVNSVVNQYKTVGISPQTLRAKANTQLIKALDSYSPDFNTQPTTHIYNNLQKVKRIATESIISGHIPEARNMKKATFLTVKANLTDQLGYEPNNKQMSEEMKWSQAEVQRMNDEVAGEVTASLAEFDFFGNSTQIEAKDKLLSDYLYNELTDKDKVIFEHTMGYGGKPILKNKDIAKKLKTHEMDIHRRKKAMSQKIKDFR